MDERTIQGSSSKLKLICIFRKEKEKKYSQFIYVIIRLKPRNVNKTYFDVGIIVFFFFLTTLQLNDIYFEVFFPLFYFYNKKISFIINSFEKSPNSLNIFTQKKTPLEMKFVKSIIHS